MIVIKTKKAIGTKKFLLKRKLKFEDDKNSNQPENETDCQGKKLNRRRQFRRKSQISLKRQ